MRYANPLKSLGFSQSATGAGKLDGRPDVVDDPFGLGRAIMIGHNAFYRSWKEGDERIVLNALLYPTPEVLPAAGRAAPSSSSARRPRRSPPAAAEGRAAHGRLAAGAQGARR